MTIGIMLLVMAGGYYGWQHYQNTLHEKVPVNSTVESSKAAIEYLNTIRAAHGKPPVKWSKTLYDIAIERIEDMHKRDYFSHYDPVTGESMIEKLLSPYTKYGAECLAGVYDEKEALDGFYTSPPHKFAMLDDLMTHAAIACRYRICVLVLAKMEDGGGGIETLGG